MSASFGGSTHQLPRLPTWQLIIGKVIFLPATPGPLHSGPWTLLTLPTPLLCHWVTRVLKSVLTACTVPEAIVSLHGVSGQHVLARIIWVIGTAAKLKTDAVQEVKPWNWYQISPCRTVPSSSSSTARRVQPVKACLQQINWTELEFPTLFHDRWSVIRWSDILWYRNCQCPNAVGSCHNYALIFFNS